MNTPPKILVVDDDVQILSLLSQYLEENGFEVINASNLADFYIRLAADRPDFVILDVKLPDGNGLDACKKIRQEGDDTPLILLTANREEVNRIVGLEIGADDYMSKPFNPRELLARIKAVHRRWSNAPHQRTPNSGFQVMLFDVFQANCETKCVTNVQSGADVQLTVREFDILHKLLQHSNRLVPRESFLERDGQPKSDAFERSVDVIISRIRKKLNAHGASVGMLKTVRSNGYQICVKVDAVERY